MLAMTIMFGTNKQTRTIRNDRLTRTPSGSLETAFPSLVTAPSPPSRSMLEISTHPILARSFTAASIWDLSGAEKEEKTVRFVLYLPVSECSEIAYAFKYEWKTYE